MKRNTIVITGISSFIGINLLEFMSNIGYNVVGTISKNLNEYSGISRSRIEYALSKNVELKKLNLLLSAEITEFVGTVKPEYWIHHAGWASNYGSLNYDLKIAHDINVLSLEPLFRSFKQINGFKGIVITGSSTEYSNTDLACNEEDACYPETPYGLSKLTETIRAMQLSYYYNIPTRIARVFIPYGRFDNPAKLIPSVVNSLMLGQKIELTECEQERDFIFIPKLLDGYGKLLDNILYTQKVFDIFNLCSGNPVKLKNLLLEIARIMNVDDKLLDFGKKQMRIGEPLRSYGSSKKAEMQLNWKSNPINEDLRKYILNYKKANI